MDDNVEVGKQWTEAEMSSLLLKVSEDTNLMRKRFHNKTSAKMPWDNFTIEGKSAAECHIAFDKMTLWVYKQISLKDIISMTKLRLEEKKVPLEMVPNAPKRPLPAFMLWFKEKYPSLAKKNPEMSLTEINTLSRSKWANLPEEKKEKYQESYKEQKEAYDILQAGFVKSKMPKKMKEKEKSVKKNDSVITPFEIYYAALPSEVQITKHDAKKNFLALDEANAVKWIWAAVEEYNKKLKDADSDTAPPTIHIKEVEKRAMLKSEGVFEKPAQTLLAFFRHRNKDDSKGPEQIEELTNIYRKLEGAQLLKLQEDHIRELNLFCLKMETYLEKVQTLYTEEELEDERHKLKPFKKLLTRFEKNHKKVAESQEKVKSNKKFNKDKSWAPITTVKEESSPKKRKSSEDSPNSQSKAKKIKSASSDSDSDTTTAKKPIKAVTPKSTKRSPKQKKSTSSIVDGKDNSSDSDSDTSTAKKPVKAVTPKPTKRSPKQKKSTSSIVDGKDDSSESDSDTTAKKPVKAITPKPTKKSPKQKKSNDDNDSPNEEEDEIITFKTPKSESRISKRTHTPKDKKKTRSSSAK